MTGDLFIIGKNSYNITNFQDLQPSNKRTLEFWFEPATYFEPQIWNLYYLIFLLRQPFLKYSLKKLNNRKVKLAYVL